MRPYLSGSVIMDFKWPLTQLLPDINLTTRKGEKWGELHIGDSIYLRQAGQEDRTLRATVLGVITGPFNMLCEMSHRDTVGENPPEVPILTYAFNPNNRTPEGMLSAMRRAYGDSFAENEISTFVLFQVDPLVQCCGGCGGVKSFDYRPSGDTKPEFYCHTCNHKLEC